MGQQPCLTVESLWFDDCPNHEEALCLLRQVLDDKGMSVPIARINATDPEVAARIRFPGSPTIRVDGQDVEPGFVDPGDYTPRCRLYPTSSGLKGGPEAGWVEEALDRALASSSGS